MCSCKHDDVVHFMYAGCCGHDGCTCVGGGCQRATHGVDCWWAKPNLNPIVSKRDGDWISALHAEGVGTRNIARTVGVKRPLVMQVIRGQIVPGVTTWWD